MDRFRLTKEVVPDRDDRGPASVEDDSEDFCEIANEAIVFPDTALGFDWNWKTSQALKELTVLQRSFVEWYVTGCGAAEAYRRASGRRNLQSEARHNAAVILRRPAVQKAVELCLKDRGVPTRIDRAARIKALEASYLRCQDKRDEKGVVRAIELLSRLHGDLVEKSEVTVMTDAGSAALKRFNAALELAKATARPQAIMDKGENDERQEEEPERSRIG